MARRWCAARILQGVGPKDNDATRLRVAPHVARAAKRYSLQPRTLHNYLHGDRPISGLLAAVIEEAGRDGKLDQVESFSAPVEAAKRQLNNPLTKELVMKLFVARSDEHEASTAFLMNDTIATRAAWTRRIEASRAAQLAVWHALDLRR